MAWTSIWPIGGSSVKGNKSAGTGNTAYIETTSKVDHYFNESASDGLHKKTEFPSDGDRVLADNSNGAIYGRDKTNAESPDNEEIQPFFTNVDQDSGSGTTNIMQLLGIRACCCFNVDATTKAVTIKYSHNMDATNPIVRNNEGIYTALYANALPNDNYMVFGAAAGNLTTTGSTKNPCTFALANGTPGFLGKGTTGAVFWAQQENPSNYKKTYVDPLSAWFISFGG